MVSQKAQTRLRLLIWHELLFNNSILTYLNKYSLPQPVVLSRKETKATTEQPKHHYLENKDFLILVYKELCLYFIGLF